MASLSNKLARRLRPPYGIKARPAGKNNDEPLPRGAMPSPYGPEALNTIQMAAGLIYKDTTREVQG